MARQLRAAGHVVYMARELGLKGQEDLPQLIKASEFGAVLTTQNQGDFRRLHDEWHVAGRDHAGILLTRQLRAVGTKIERLERAARLLTPDRAANQVLRLDLFGTEEQARGYVRSLTPLP